MGALLVHAGKQLLDEVTAHDPSMEYELAAVDGFNRYRQIKFDPQTSTWLAPAMEAVADSRIQAAILDDQGWLWVTFVSDARADRRTRFGVVEASVILAEPDEPPAEATPSPKAPAKRAAPKRKQAAKKVG